MQLRGLGARAACPSQAETALSNDLLGDLDKQLTYDINLHESIRLAEAAKKAGCAARFERLAMARLSSKATAANEAHR